MKNNKEMDIVFLLDRSGSMQGSEQETINAYNKFISNQKNNNYKVNITTILFDDQYEVLISKKDINKVKKLTTDDYYARGCTALLDAIGKTINLMSNTKHKVLFVITTDGLENASQEYSKSHIKNLIKNKKNWEFIYIGADIDSFNEGGELGIKRNNIANYHKTKEGIDNMFLSVEKAAASLYYDNKINDNWNSELK